MHDETYYYIFSLLAVILCLTHLVNIYLFRTRSLSIMGMKYKPGTKPYEKMLKFSSPKGIIIAALVTALVVCLFVYDIFRVLSFNNPKFALVTFIWTIPLVVSHLIMIKTMASAYKKVQ